MTFAGAMTGGGGVAVYYPPPVIVPPPDPAEDTITDRFNRTVAGGWGTADSGDAWTTSGASSTYGVDGARASVASSVASLRNGVLAGTFGDEVTATAQMAATGVFADQTACLLEFDFGSNAGGFPTLVLTFNALGGWEVSCPSAASSASGTLGFVPTTEFKVRMKVVALTGYVRIWRAVDAEPVDWTATVAIAANMVGQMRTFAFGRAGDGSATITGYIENLNIEGADPPPPAPVPSGPQPFLSYPASAAFDYNGRADVVIEGKTFRALGSLVIAVRLVNCQRITIRNCDFADVAECLYAVNCSDITITDCRFRNITGPAQPRTGANVANFVQMNNVNGGLIARNKGLGGDTEDVISLYKSSNFIVEDNHIEGTNWTSGSGSGIAIGDDGGSNNIARRNILVNPGQVGIFIAGGVNNQIRDNILIGQQRPKSNVGMYVWNQYQWACSGHTVTGNKVSWKHADGFSNPFYNANNCGPVAGTNDLNASLNIEQYRVVL